MDWGFGAIGNLYTGKSASDRQKEKRETIGLMENQFVKENAEKEQAQLKKQAYDAQVQEFANKLLGPDRDKINQRAKILQSKVKEQIKYYGGDMTKFFANGGHNVMADYRSQVVNSAEATEYLENQKNALMLADLTMKGMGDQINANDLQSLRDYNTNKGGKVTYTGLLNKIKMPDANKYQYGQEIPAEDIFRENRFAIIGNFITEKGRMPYDDLEAINYTKLTTGSKGSNYQYGLQLQQEKNRHEEQIMDASIQQQKNWYDYQAKVIAAQNKAGGTIKTTDANGNEVEVPLTNLPGYQTPNDKDAKGVGGFKQSIAERTMSAISKVGQQIPAADFISGKAFKGDNALELNQSAEVIADGDLIYTEQSVSEKNKTFDFDPKFEKNSFWGGVGDVLAGNDSFRPAQAKKLYGVNTNVIAKGLLKLDKMDVASGKAVGFRPNENDFMVKGNRVADNGDPYDFEKYSTPDNDWTVKGIYTGGVGKDKDGRDSLVMDLMHKGKVAGNNKQYQEEMYGSGTINMKQMIVLENKYGDVIYRPLENNPHTATAIKNILDKNDDLVPVMESALDNNTNTSIDKAAAKKRAGNTKKFWSLNNNDPLTERTIQTQTALFAGKDGVTTARNSFLKGYYGAINQFSDQPAETPNDFRNGVVNSPVSSFVNYFKELENEKFPIRELMSSATSDKEILGKLIQWSNKNGQTDQIEFLQSWLDHITEIDKM